MDDAQPPPQSGAAMPPDSAELPGQETGQTLSVTNALLSVYRGLQAKAGSAPGHDHFLEWATDNPAPFYNLFIKLLARESGAEVGTRTVVGALVFRGVND